MRRYGVAVVMVALAWQPTARADPAAASLRGQHGVRALRPGERHEPWGRLSPGLLGYASPRELAAALPTTSAKWQRLRLRPESHPLNVPVYGTELPLFRVEVIDFERVERRVQLLEADLRLEVGRVVRPGPGNWVTLVSAVSNLERRVSAIEGKLGLPRAPGGITAGQSKRKKRLAYEALVERVQAVDARLGALSTDLEVHKLQDGEAVLVGYVPRDSAELLARRDSHRTILFRAPQTVAMAPVAIPASWVLAAKAGGWKGVPAVVLQVAPLSTGRDAETALVLPRRDLPELRFRESGDAVRILVRYLEKAGFAPTASYSRPGLTLLGTIFEGLAPKPLFGVATYEAVRDFQGRLGLPATGVVDRDTWAALLGAAGRSAPPADVPTEFTPLAFRSTGPAVRDLERRLRRAGVPPSTTYTSMLGQPLYGKATHLAVEEFQRRNGLVTSGKVDRPTWAALIGG